MIVALLPHSSNSGIAKNDDHDVTKRLQQRVEQDKLTLPILDPMGDPRLARALIGQANVFVASRFHSMACKVRFVNPARTYAQLKDELDAAYFAVMEKGDLIDRGQLKSFEQNLADFAGTTYAVGLNSGYDALHMRGSLGSYFINS